MCQARSVAVQLFGRIVLLAAPILALPALGQSSAQDKSVDATPKLLAFVIGVDTYEHLGEEKQLERAVGDANDVANELISLGFNIVGGVGANVTRDAFNVRWQTFLSSIKPGRGDNVVVFLAGHGMAVEGRNYFFPSNAPFKRAGRQGELERESISLTELVIDLQERKPRVSVVLIDACRENPFIPAMYRKAGMGGVSVTGDGVLMVYSAGGDEIAHDRLPGTDNDRNSVFGRVLVPMLASLKGQPVYQAWVQQLQKKVSAVASKAGLKQTPKFYSGLEGEFCLLDDCGRRWATLGSRPEKLDWRAMRNSCEAWDELRFAQSFHVDDYEFLDFTSRFRGQPCADQARAVLQARGRLQSTLHVLSIGVGRFEDRSLRELRFAARDAMEVDRVLKLRGADAYGRVRNMVLSDESGTRQRILASLQELRREAKANDTVFVYFSGQAEEINGVPYLLPYNARVGDIESYVKLSDVQTSLKETFGHRVLLLDSCGIGVTSSVRSSLVDPSVDDQISVIAAGIPGGSVSLDYATNSSPFTTALLSALRPDKRSPVTVRSLGESVVRYVSAMATRESLRQQPFWTSSQADTVILP